VNAPSRSRSISPAARIASARRPPYLGAPSRPYLEHRGGRERGKRSATLRALSPVQAGARSASPPSAPEGYANSASDIGQRLTDAMSQVTPRHGRPARGAQPRRLSVSRPWCRHAEARSTSGRCTGIRAMVDPLIRKLEQRDTLSDEEKRVLTQAVSHTRNVGPDEDLVWKVSPVATRSCPTANARSRPFTSPATSSTCIASF
jgi:hypothetical protein